MSFLQILLAIILFVLAIGLTYYFKVISDFKKFLQFEVDLKAHPSDEGVKEYMRKYQKTYIPNQPKIQAARANVYRVIKASDQVSYETKKELKQFFEEREIVVLSTLKKDSDVSEDID